MSKHQEHVSILSKPFSGTQAQVDALEELRHQFTITNDMSKQIAKTLLSNMEEGLRSEDACVAMLPSWLHSHPTGQETGDYLGLELTGALIRIYFVRFQGRGRLTTRQQKYKLTDTMKTSTLAGLVDTLADIVDQFLTFLGNSVTTPLHLGFVLSFPLHQTAINKASVAKWTKSFAITAYENKNVVELLQTALNRRSIPVHVSAIINGACASLLANGYRSLDTLLSCTISNGTNAAYWEKLNAVKKLGTAKDDQETIVNTEWGSFGDNNREVLPLSMYDNRVNRQSENPGVHTFEKMVSGVYLGELVRTIIVEFMDRRILFAGQYTKELNTQYGFDTSYMGRIGMDEDENLNDTGHILEDIMGLPPTSLDDRRIVKTICELVGQRAARLIGTAISAIIDKRHALDDCTTLSVEGIIYEHFPNFPRRLTETLRRIYGNESVERINIMVTKDGNGIGAALAALLASQQK
ncbi:hexokinase-domain-containing protein [Halteromyces radiatus]|uniref:hexokinase-domain-containing protein n=1 Tax=Halteromyces radiatus TaxID=101107 RepID=UPI00221F1420|nr:hexokinase-domain-containing protein [Halteromyces radiatus]KAI8099022.1 hexokinase-domain-containing protein [Halteromyces radiatus]